MATKKTGGSEGAVKLRIKLGARSGESGSAQVARQVRELIDAGRLKPGDALPSEDGLAEQLGVGRKVVRHAYAKLVEEGLLVSDFPRNKKVAAKKSRSAAKSAGSKAGAKKGAGR
jgi:DNA-binding FadR family transcriptional regulator